MRYARVALFTLGLGLVGTAVHAQDPAAGFPIRPLRFIVPFTPGGTNDIMARLVSGKLSERHGWTTLVENRAGAGGAIGAAAVANSAPDGYTLLTVSTSHTVVGAVQKLPYDPVKSFTPIAMLATGPSVVTVTPSLPVNSIADLIAMAKAKPGQLTYSSSGIGAMNHFVGELFNLATKTSIVHVPYKGGTPAMADLIAGHIQVYHGGLAAVLPLIRAGKMKALGVTSLERAPAAPEIPAVAETVPGFEAMIWYGIFAAASTPAPIVNKLNAEINAVMRDPDVAKRLEGEGAMPATLTADAFAKFVAADVAKWSSVAKAAGIKGQ